LQLGQFDPLRFNSGNHLIELFLRGDDNPARSDDLTRSDEVLADFAELLDRGAQVFDLVTAAGHVLTHLINDEDERLAGPPSTEEIEGPLNNLAHRDGGVSVALGVRPRVG
jgi:hypothetical protein